MSLRFLLGFFSGPLAALLLMLFVDLDPSSPMLTRMAAIALWVAIWWMTEIVPLAVTSLLPFLLIPIFGIADTNTIAREYMDPILFLFIGGFILAIGIERWNVHKRIALNILSLLGKSPATILAGIMLTSYLISMWISNTATVMMLFAAVMALANRVALRDKNGYAIENDRSSTAFMIGLAYSATIGGMATLVGTPPNMVFYRFYTNAYPLNADISFAKWFMIGFPLSLCLLILAYFVLRLLFIPKRNNPSFEISYFKEERDQLGKMKFDEKMVASLFGITALLWFTRTDLDLGSFQLKGWKHLFPHPENITDGTVAIGMAMLLFFIPSRSEPKRMLLNWTEASKLPFHILLLFGSGFALAKGFEVSGLSAWLAEKLFFLDGVHPVILVLSICVLVTIISELASNVASIQLMLPILLALSPSLKVDPLLLMIPATFAASLGFMLPIATAPNTIVFGSNKIKVKEMMRAGLVLNILGILLVTLFVWLWK